MSDVNDNAIRVEKLIKEHLRLQQGVRAIDVQIAKHQADVVILEDQSNAYSVRMDRIASELAPALKAAGSVVWRHNRADYVVQLRADGGITIEEVKSWGALASAMRPKMFTSAEITEAAMFAVAEQFEAEDDDSDPATWAAWTDAVRATLPIAAKNGRTPTIANGVAVTDQAAS